MIILVMCAAVATQPAAPALPTQVMREISQERVRATVDALAAFGTRHTMSETESDVRGIGAARRYL